jgi:hypothetical protein
MTYLTTLGLAVGLGAAPDDPPPKAPEPPSSYASSRRT